MKNVSCRKCGESIAQNALTCPKCGRRNRRSRRSKRLKVLSSPFFVIFLIVGAALIGYLIYDWRSGGEVKVIATSSGPPIPALGPTQEVSSLQLYQNYQADEVAADKKYRGHSLEVSGVVESIHKDAANGLFLTLVTPHELGSVEASLQYSELSGLANLTQGSSVVVVCEGAGMIMDSPVLHDCKIK